MLRCSKAFREQVYPLLKLDRDTVQLALKDLPTFCGCVLPKSENWWKLRIRKAFCEALPEECAPCFYFDMEGEELTLNVLFRYGERTFSPKDRLSEEDGGILNMTSEELLSLLETG